MSNAPAPRLPRGPYRARIGSGESATDHLVATGNDGLTLDGEPVEGGVSLVPAGPSRYRLHVGATSSEVVVEARDAATLTLSVDGQRVVVEVADAQAQMLERLGMGTGASARQREVKAPMPGLVLAVHVAPGDAVEAGQRLVVLEAMKMENEIKAPQGGTVARVPVATGDAVAKGTVLVEFAS